MNAYGDEHRSYAWRACLLGLGLYGRIWFPQPPPAHLGPALSRRDGPPPGHPERWRPHTRPTPQEEELFRRWSEAGTH